MHGCREGEGPRIDPALPLPLLSAWPPPALLHPHYPAPVAIARKLHGEASSSEPSMGLSLQKGNRLREGKWLAWQDPASISRPRALIGSGVGGEGTAFGGLPSL